MADNRFEQLPPGWVHKNITSRNGTIKSIYENCETKQKFETKEQLERYLNYRNNISPCLDDLRECYGDGKGGFVERPWENDRVYSFNDYAMGRVGRVKYKLESENSCVTSNDHVSDLTETSQPADQVNKKKAKGKGKGKGKKNK